MNTIIALAVCGVFWLNLRALYCDDSNRNYYGVSVSQHLCTVDPKNWPDHAKALTIFLGGYNLILQDINDCVMDTIAEVYPKDEYDLNKMSLTDYVRFVCADAFVDIATCAIPYKYPKGIQQDFRPILEILDKCQGQQY